MRILSGALVLLQACGSGGAGETPVPSPTVSLNDTSPLGINLTTAGLSNNTPEIVFKDLFKQSGPWTTTDLQPLTPDGTPIPAPGQAAWTQMCRSLYGHYPGGTYICLYEGSGLVQFGSDATIVGGSPGRLVVDVRPSPSPDGILLRIASSNPSDPVRNIRFVPEVYESDSATAPFHPPFLARWSRFKTIRFMNWQRANTSTVVHWSERTLPIGAQTGPFGVALEHMIQLSNALHADPWFCMPHRASDDFVRQFASSVASSLDASLQVYLEYANEAWNPVFATEPWSGGLRTKRDDPGRRCENRGPREVRPTKALRGPRGRFEVSDERSAVRISVRGILRHHFPNHPADALRNLSAYGACVGYRFREMAADDLEGGASGERSLSGHQVKKRRAERIEIRATVDLATASSLFRGHVMGRAHGFARHRQFRAGAVEDVFREPKVEELGPRWGHEDVVGLDVPMDDPLLVRVPESSRDLADDRDRSRDVERKMPGKRLAFAILHDVVGVPVFLAGREGAHEVGMLQFRGLGRLSDESPAKLGVRRKVLG